MSTAVDLMTHPDFTVADIERLTGWAFPPVPTYRENFGLALAYFQQVVPRVDLRKEVDAGSWNLRIFGLKIQLLNWLQAIDFRKPVIPRRMMSKGDWFISYRSSPSPPGQVTGHWYAYPYTGQDRVAIYRDQVVLHKFKARAAFACMESTVSDAFAAWRLKQAGEYRHGGGQQLFIWDPGRVLRAV